MCVYWVQVEDMNKAAVRVGLIRVGTSQHLNGVVSDSATVYLLCYRQLRRLPGRLQLGDVGGGPTAETRDCAHHLRRDKRNILGMTSRAATGVDLTKYPMEAW